MDRTEHGTNEDVLQMVEAERVTMGKKKVKEAGLYSAYTEVPYTQGAQVRIKLHRTCLYLVSIHQMAHVSPFCRASLSKSAIWQGNTGGRKERISRGSATHIPRGGAQRPNFCDRNADARTVCGS